ncbi:MAG TPA: hypothetical protein VFP50_15510 [Anaeromyxobacteraceae bacterium]|nr:hypothetical protein [Anaeromyxobacteraceae bacterium]
MASERMAESDAQDFLARLSQCVVAAHNRGDHGTAQVLREGMEEFERLRKAEPVDHAFVPGVTPGTSAWCARSGCGRGSDEHLAFGLAANVAPLRERLRLIATAGRTMAANTSHPRDRMALEGLADLAEKGPTR